MTGVVDVAGLAERLGLEPLNAVHNRKVTGVFISDMVSDVMAGAAPGHVWVTVQTHKNIIAAANLVDVACIIVTRGKAIPRETIDIADRVELTLFSTPLETFSLAVRLHQAGVGSD